MIDLFLNNCCEMLVVVGMVISSEFFYFFGLGVFLLDLKSFGVFYVKRSFVEEVYDFFGVVNEICGWFLFGDVVDVEGIFDILENELLLFGVCFLYFWFW